MVSQRQMQACQREESSDTVEIKTTRAMSASCINHWDNPHQDRHLFECVGQKKLPWSVETEPEREAVAFPWTLYDLSYQPGRGEERRTRKSKGHFVSLKLKYLHSLVSDEQRQSSFIKSP